MADTFMKREKGEELRFEIKQEIQFKAVSRRNRLLGEWLARKFGMTSDETEAYVKEVVISDLDEPGIDDVVRKVMKDIENHGAGISEDEVRAEMERLFTVALEQVKEGFKSDTV
ncbi:MAG: hypothetical protein CMM60_05125 [Rhodospirillaceae bacterium]|nr:hypothetical protein [Rhodospirillaceae bacterium]|tara:strand:- start:4629 stop:4970 length:342 start_codon:yes stop_codon:yes gene_type:complete